MAIAVRTQETDDQLVVIKVARTDGDAARLEREATMLARSRHPGVVELLHVADRALHLRHAGTPLSRLGPFPVDQAAGIVSAVADIVQALHRLGVVHGALGDEHVLIDTRGRPRLCGFGEARELTPEAAADDVAALGELLRSLLTTGGHLPWAHPGTGLGRRGAQRRARHELDALAARATSAERHHRPSARQLAKAIHVAVPDQSLPTADEAVARPRLGPVDEIPADVDPTADLAWISDQLAFLASGDPEDLHDEHGDRETAGPPDPGGHHRGGARGRHRAGLLGVAALAVVLTFGVIAGATGARALRPFGAGQVSTTAATTTTSTAVGPTTTAAPGSAWPEHCPVPVPTGPDVDGDGCPEPIDLDGRSATLGRLTVTIGADGDLVALGDWHCDGIDTPALLRPATGEVFVFPDWAVDAPLEVTATTVVPAATSIGSGPGACPEPVLTTAAGRRGVEVER